MLIEERTARVTGVDRGVNLNCVRRHRLIILLLKLIEGVFRIALVIRFGGLHLDGTIEGRDNSRRHGI